jgi:hypothetical protein
MILQLFAPIRMVRVICRLAPCVLARLPTKRRR